MTLIPAGTTAIYRGVQSAIRAYEGLHLRWGQQPLINYFDSAFTTRGDLSAYDAFINADDPSRAAVVTSPTDPDRKVLRMASQAGVTHGNEWPRTAIETDDFIRSLARGNSNDIYYNAVSFYLSDEFTTMTSSDWISIIGLAWGPPWSGSGSVTIQMRSPEAGSDEHRMMLGGAQLPIGTAPRNQWVNLIVGFKFAYEEEGGWVSLWRHNGEAWDQVPIEGDLQHPFNPLIRGGNDGWHTGASGMANTSRTTVYGSKPWVVYFGEHFVTSSFEEATKHYETTSAPAAVGYQQATENLPASVRSYSTTNHTSDTLGVAAETVARPPIIQPGDLLVLYTIGDTGATETWVQPPGWTLLGKRIGSPGARHFVSYKVATDNEPATYTYQQFNANSDGASLVLAVKDWDGNTANLSFAMSTNTNTTLDTPSVTPKTARNLLLTSVATDDDIEAWDWGWTPPKEAGAVGYTHNEIPEGGGWSSGAVSHEIWDSEAPTGTRTWAVNTGSTQTTRLTTALTIGSGSATRTTTQFTDTTHTGGTGGDLTDTTANPFVDTAGTSSTYHLYAAGLDWTKNVGLMIYTDGSEEYGLKNPDLPYLLAGDTGMIAVAKRQNMVLLTPLAPGGPCNDGDGTCWYDHSAAVPGGPPVTSPWQKLEWSNELIRWILTRYDIDRRRIVIGGYSSGAQWTTAWFGPKYASEVMEDGVAVAISYGGQPRVPPAVTAEHKTAVPYVWDVGDQDDAYIQTAWDDGVITGMSWYDANAYAVTHLELHPGVTHDRWDINEVGEYGTIMEREITARVPPA